MLAGVGAQRHGAVAHGLGVVRPLARARDDELVARARDAERGRSHRREARKRERNADSRRHYGSNTHIAFLSKMCVLYQKQWGRGSAWMLSPRHYTASVLSAKRLGNALVAVEQDLERGDDAILRLLPRSAEA